MPARALPAQLPRLPEQFPLGTDLVLLADFVRLPSKALAADLGAERELPVREGARAREAGRDVAIGLAVDALVGLRFGAAALFDRLTLFDHHDFFL